MEHPNHLTALIADAAAESGVMLTRHQSETLGQHLGLVLEANLTTNLTRIVEPRDAVRRHVIDSLLGLPEVQANDGAIADLGSGPGYPGIVLAVATGRKTTLVESNGKKSRFLNAAVGELGLVGLVSVYPGRAEELAAVSAGDFGVITSRALSTLAAVVELATPLLAPNGVCVAYKGGLTDEEIRAGDDAARICGCTRESVRNVDLPGGDDARTIVAYRRSSEPQIELPRRTGLAQRRPLA